MSAELEAAQREIGRLQKVLELQKHALDRYRPCSDHNGKVKPLYEWQCQWCRAERAEHKVARLERELRCVTIEDRERCNHHWAITDGRCSVCDAEWPIVGATEDREDGETCPDCREVIFDGRCRCAEADAKIYDAKMRGEP